MTKRYFLFLLLCVSVFSIYGQTTYYYKLTNIDDNKISLEIQGGQFVTFIGDICYESDKKGIGVGHGTMTYNPNYSTSSVKKYIGESYWGDNAVYAFNADKSVLNVVLENNMVLVYKRTSPPDGVNTCSLIRPQDGHSSENADNSYDLTPPILIDPIVQNPLPTNQDSNLKLSPQKRWKTITYQESCPSCHGSGKCWTCNGKGWCYNGFGISGTHDCPNCTNGNCTHCNGTGKITKTEQVYEY